MNYMITHIKIIIASILTIFLPVTPLILTVLCLVMVDFFLAIYRVWRENPKKIESRKMSNTVSKLLIYSLCILSLFLIETQIISMAIPLSKIGAGLISFVELKSIDETFKLMLGYSLLDLMIKVAKRGESNTKDIIDVIDEDKTT